MRLLPALLCAALPCATLPASPAWAHAILVSSTPAPLAHVPPGTLTAVLHYNSRIDALRSKLTLTGPDKQTQRLTLATDAPPDTLSAQLSLTPGAYTLRWQVLATDGHLTRGTVPFTVDAAH